MKLSVFNVASLFRKRTFVNRKRKAAHTYTHVRQFISTWYLMCQKTTSLYLKQLKMENLTDKQHKYRAYIYGTVWTNKRRNKTRSTEIAVAMAMAAIVCLKQVEIKTMTMTAAPTTTASSFVKFSFFDGDKIAYESFCCICICLCAKIYSIYILR